MKKDILVPVMTPMNEDESVNYNALKKLVKKVIAEGADGIYACGSTGESFSLTTEERKKILEVIIEAANGKYVNAHVGEISTIKAIDLAKHAESVGANAISSVVPFYFNYSYPEIKAYYENLSAAVKIPLYIYNMPSNTVYLPMNQLEELLMIDNVAGMKFTDMNYYVLEQLKSKTKKYIYSGVDECYLSALSAGADGVIGTTLNFMVGKFIKIRNLFAEGKLKEALENQAQINNIVRALLDVGIMPGVKYILSLQGIDAGVSRSPFKKLNKEEKEHIKAVYYENI